MPGLIFYVMQSLNFGSYKKKKKKETRKTKKPGFVCW